MSDQARRTEPQSRATAATTQAPWRFAAQLSGPRDQWTRERVLAAIGEWAREVGRAPRSYEWAPSTARELGYQQSAGVQKWQGESPRWPSATTVRRYCGPWRAALLEADVGSLQPLRMPLQERLEISARLAHLPAHVVADIIGVHVARVQLYRVAGRCPGCGGPKVTPSAAVCGVCRQRPSRDAWSREDIVEAMRAWTQRTGRRPSQRD